METTEWQREDVTKHYLENVRGGIPFGAEQAQLMLRVVKHFQPAPKMIVDLGCGNGFLAEILLKTFPQAKAICIDHSEPMVLAAKENLATELGRCNIVHADFSENLQKYIAPNSVDCIVSGYAIHHLPQEKKKKLYQEIYESLAPEGIFINVEHTASATPKLEALHDELFVEHLANYTNREIEVVAEEYYGRPDMADNILERVDIQVEWLRQIGFEHADCYFKWMELAVFGGIKKAE